MIRNLVLVFEEIVMQGISARENVFPINVTISVSESGGESEIEIIYGGERFDPVTDGDLISASIVKDFSSGINFRYESGINRFRSFING
ncbi:MAG: hypothetical protein J6I47_00655 [Ruminococcus sp.]|nr:hypothetical protein [Ruminococcus sp.]